jgi:hypothetical protein
VETFSLTYCDKVYQLLAHGWWFSPASSTTKTGRHEMLLKVALSTIKSNQIRVKPVNGIPTLPI